MKLLKNLGIVVGIHAFALLAVIMIFANPGCSASKAQSATASAPTGSDAPSVVPAPMVGSGSAPQPVAAPDASSPSPAVLYSPTRPGTPAAAALEAQPVAGVTPATTYTVVSHDSLSSIAKKNHLKISELAAANGLRPGAPLHVGQKLLIPKKAVAETTGETAPAPAAPASAVTPAKPPAAPVKHVVKPGETLGAIARKYGVRVGDIAAANNISDPQKIHPGLELVIPGGSARAGKAAASKAAKPAAADVAPPPAPAPSSTKNGDAEPNQAGPGDVPVIKVDDALPPAPSKSQ